MISEQHQREASSYDTFHDEGSVCGNITFGFRFYKFNNLIGCKDLRKRSSMLDAKIIGNIRHTMLLEPSSINSDIKQNERNIRSVLFPHSLNLIAIPFTEKNCSFYYWELCHKLFPCESLLKMQKQRGRKLSIICPASESGGNRVVWLPDNPDISTVNFFINYPTIYGAELRASIVPDDKRLTELLS